MKTKILLLGLLMALGARSAFGQIVTFQADQAFVNEINASWGSCPSGQYVTGTFLGQAPRCANGSTLTPGTGLIACGTGTICLQTPVLPINGGTGTSAPTAHGILIGEGLAGFDSVVCPFGQLLVSISTSGDPVCSGEAISSIFTQLYPGLLNGTDAIGPFNGARSGEKNVADFGILSANGSQSTTTGSVTGTALTVGSNSYVNGQWLLIPQAGPTNTEAAPSPAPTVTAVSQDWVPDQVITSAQLNTGATPFIIHPVQNNAGSHWYWPTAAGTTSLLINCQLQSVSCSNSGGPTCGTATVIINLGTGCYNLTNGAAIVSGLANNGTLDGTYTITASGSPATSFSFSSSSSSYQNGNGGIVDQYPIVWPQGTDGSTVVDGGVTWTKCDSTCSQAYLYKTAFLNINGGESAASSASTSVTNAKPLDNVHNYNIVGTTPDSIAESVVVYGNPGGAGYSLLGAAPNSTDNYHTTADYRDNGTTYLNASSTIAGTPPSSATNNALSAKIVSGGGTRNIVLSAAASNSVSGVSVYPDDAPIFNLAIAAQQYTCQPNTLCGGNVYAPNGLYIQSSPILAGSATSGNILSGESLEGSTAQGANILATTAMAGLPQVLCTNCNTFHVSGLSLWGGPANAFPLAGIEQNHINPNSGQVSAGFSLFENNQIGGGYVNAPGFSIWDGIIFTSRGANENNNDHNTVIGNSIGNCTDAAVGILHLNSLENKIIGNSLSCGSQTMVAFNGGSATVANNAGAAGSYLATVPGFMVDMRAGDYVHKSTFSGNDTESVYGLARSETTTTTTSAASLTINANGASDNNGQFPIIWKSSNVRLFLSGALAEGSPDGGNSISMAPTIITNASIGSQFVFGNEFVLSDDLVTQNPTNITLIGSGNPIAGFPKQISGIIGGTISGMGFGYAGASSVGNIFGSVAGAGSNFQQDQANALYMDGGGNLNLNNHQGTTNVCPAGVNNFENEGCPIGAIDPATIFGTMFNSVPAVTSQSGTGGTVGCSESMQGTLKIANCVFTGYYETGSAQTYSFPTAFNQIPSLIGGSCDYNAALAAFPSTTTSTLTLPAGGSMNPISCNLTLVGN
jgi:hypothetical protein